MLLFRSEGHVTRWLEGRRAGASIPVGTLCDLAHAWWSDRLDPAWQPHTRDQNQAILDGLGLTGPFWELPVSAAADTGGSRPQGSSRDAPR